MHDDHGYENIMIYMIPSVASGCVRSPTAKEVVTWDMQVHPRDCRRISSKSPDGGKVSGSTKSISPHSLSTCSLGVHGLSMCAPIDLASPYTFHPKRAWLQ